MLVVTVAIMVVNNNVGRFASGAVIILNNNIDRYWSRYYTKQQGWSLLYLTTILVAAGAVIILYSIVGRSWSRYYT